MHHGAAIQATKDIYWDIRPRPQMGTIEFRIFDAPATFSSLLALTALTRALVIEALGRLADNPKLQAGDPEQFWLAQHNRWLATRYGLRAECVRSRGGEFATLADDVAELLERLAPVASEAGDAGYLNAFEPLDAFETGAERQRGIYRQTGSWQAVIDDMKNRWLRELESEERQPAAAAT